MQLRHLNIDLYECSAALDDVALLERVLITAATTIGATVVDSLTHQFVPHGLTVVLILAESHLIVSTWPEYRYANVDIFLCNSNLTEKIWKTIESLLTPIRTEIHVVDHPSP